MELDKDNVFLCELREGKEGAFQKIYGAYWEDLYTYVARIMEHETEAEDIVQEVFLTLWKIRNNINHVHSLKAYLFAIAKNGVVKFLMKRQHRKAYSDSLKEYLTEATESLEQKIAVNELSSIIDAEIATLPSKMQQIFILSRKDYLSHKEIAEILEISDQTVKKQISNSIKYLKQRLRNIIQ